MTSKEEVKVDAWVAIAELVGKDYFRSRSRVLVIPIQMKNMMNLNTNILSGLKAIQKQVYGQYLHVFR